MIDLPRPDGREATAELLVHINQEGVRRASIPFTLRLGNAYRYHEDGGAASRRSTQHGFDAAFGGARRDEEKSRAKERIFSFRTAQQPGTRRTSGRSCGTLYNTPHRQGEIDPRLPAVELDRARHLAVHHAGGHPDRAALFRRGAAGGRARRHADHGRRRAHAADARRGAADAHGALPHARLLSADRRDRDPTPRRSTDIVSEMLRRAHLRAAGPPDRPRRVRPRWKRRSAKAISDERAAGSRASAVDDA